MSTGRRRQHQLLNDVKRNIASIEDAIHHTVDTKRNLKTSALEVKGQIHSCVSRQLEALRNREVWLLNQVETIQQAKEEVLRLQLGKLNQSLGSLKNCAAYTTLYMDGLSEELDPKVIEEQLMENLCSLTHLHLTPEENASICFRANRGKLREMIHDFGRVDSRSISVNQQRAFTMDPNLPSSSLPSPFEDYEDLDHHVLYKTLAELKEQKQKVCFPDLSPRNEDWLIKAPANTPAEIIPNVVFQTLKDATPASSTVNTATAAQMKADEVQMWLHHVPTGYHSTASATEDEEFPMMDQSRCVSEIVSAKAAQTTDGDVETAAFDMSPYFKFISSSPDMEWLLDSDRIRASYTYGKDYPYAAMKYFRERSNDVKDWLFKYEAVHDDNSVMEKVDPDCHNSNPITPNTQHFEIENLDTLPCFTKTMGRYFEEISSDTKVWLSTNLDKEQSLETCCMANEKCQQPSECVSDTHCLGDKFNQSETFYNPIQAWYDITSNNPCDWLMPTNQAAMNESENSALFEYFCIVSASKVTDWLQVPCVPQSSHLCQVKSPFDQSLHSAPINSKKKKVPTATLR